MNFKYKVTVLIAGRALGATPALATAHGHSSTTSSNAKRYGYLCQSFSKKHVAGTPGTPFSKCVTDMAHMANGTATSARAACKNMPKKHAGVKGKGTEFSQCVKAAAKLKKSGSGTTTTTATTTTTGTTT
jgi:hypothetical protein